MKNKSTAKSIRKSSRSKSSVNTSINNSKHKISKKAVIAKRAKVHRPKHKLKGVEIPSPKDLGIKSQKSLKEYGKEEFDLTLPEPPLPPEARKKEPFKFSLFGQQKQPAPAVESAVEPAVEIPRPEVPVKRIGEKAESHKAGRKEDKQEIRQEIKHEDRQKVPSGSSSIKSPKVVRFDDSDFKFSPDFEEKVTRLLIDSSKKIQDKKKRLVNEYKTHLDNHLKIAKLEIGKAEQAEKDTGFFSFLKKDPKPMSAEELIASVEVDKEPVVTDHVKIDIDRIIRSNKLHAEKARELKESFKSHIKEQIEALEFNVNFRISDSQPYFDDLTKMQKSVSMEEIPKYEDFVREEEKPVPAETRKADMKKADLKRPELKAEVKPKPEPIRPEMKPQAKKTGLFSSFFVESEKENPVIEDVEPEDKSADESAPMPPVPAESGQRLPTRKEIEEEEESGDALDKFFSEEKKRQSAFKLVIPADKLKERIEKRKSIEDHEQDISKRELDLIFAKEHHAREREDFEIHRTKTDTELREIQSHIDAMQKQLDLKKLELSEREASIREREENLKRKEIDTKRIIEKEVEINDLKITVDTKSSDLKKREQLVAARERTIDEKIRKSESLKAEIERHKKLETFEADLNKREARINEKLSKLSEKESNLKNKEDELKIKDKMLSEKESVLNSRLKNFKKEKTASLEKKEAELKKLQESLDVKTKELEKYDRTLVESRKDLKKEAEKVEDAEFNLLVDEEKLKSRGDVVPETVKFEDIEKIDEIMDLPELKQAEIYRLVSRCRDVLRQKNFAAAKQIYNEIKDRYSKLECPDDEKQIVYNTIRELYDDIRLEML